MLIRNDDGTFLAGPLDALLILRNVETGRFHAALFVERPFPGPVPPVDEVQIVRLVSQGHHTEGSDTLDGAQVHVDDFKARIDVHGNVFRVPVEWDGSHGVVLVRDNWRRDPSWQPEPPSPGILRDEVRPCQEIAGSGSPSCSDQGRRTSSGRGSP